MDSEEEEEEEEAFDLENYTVWDETPLDTDTLDRDLFENAFCPSLHGFTPPLEFSGLMQLPSPEMAQIRQDWPTIFTELIDSYVAHLIFWTREGMDFGTRVQFSPHEFIQESGGFHTKEWLDELYDHYKHPPIVGSTLMGWETRWLEWKGMIRYFQKLEECNEEENPPMLMGANRRLRPAHRKNRVFIS